MSEEKKSKYDPQNRYRARVVRKFTVDVNRNTEMEMLEHLERQPNVNQYIKGLIRADMGKQK